ncbi:hypothetical protein B0J17DRAFT_672092 [Rhizoctonia solani]|nr:hypothetical protein B0J17DRAFT_672092 [Rhizoctonia solani]
MDPTPPTGTRVLTRFGACLVCRRRKLRCDAAQPECNRCHTSGSTCQYQDSAYRSRTRVLQEQIKELEAKIEEVENQRDRPSSRTPGSPSQDGPNLASGTLLSQSIPKFFAFIPDNPVRQAAGPSSPLVPGVYPESSTLSRRGPSAISLPGDAPMKLLNTFMQRKHVSGFELHTGRVVRSFQPGSREPAVPALYYAMLLLGCHFSSEPELKFWENTVYEHTKLELEMNITRAHLNDRSKYNPLHHLQAMIMLGQWFYLKNRLLEGHVYTTRAMRFAVVLGLHELDSRIYDHSVALSQEPLRRGVERWRPRDPIELGEAINLWWSGFTRDFAGTILNGLPPSISLDEIKTVWPVSLSEFEDLSGSELPNDNHSVASLLGPRHLNVVADVSQNTAHCVLAKGVLLTHCAGMLDNERISGLGVTDEWLVRFEECDRATKTFTESVRKAYIGRNIEEVAMIALAQAVVDCAAIQLHAPLADYGLDICPQTNFRGLSPDNSLGKYSYTRCMEASRSIALAAAYIELEGVDASYMQLLFGVSLSCAARVLAKQIPRLCQNGYVEKAQEMEQHIAIMAKSMERLLLAYPVLSSFMSNCVKTT